MIGRALSLGGKSIFIYIIQGDVSDFSKLLTAWVFLNFFFFGVGGSYMGFGSSLKQKLKGEEQWYG